LRKMAKNKYTIGIANISSYTSDENLRTVSEILCSLYGCYIVKANNIGLRHHFYSGTAKDRASGLIELQARDDVDVIMFLRGGYGAVKTLEYLDNEAMKRFDKPMIGMSDLTALFIHYYQRTGKIAFHGPNLVSEFLDPKNTKNKRDIFRKLNSVSGSPLIGSGDMKQSAVISCGKAEARIIGGNLSTLVSMIGTPYIRSFKGHIIFLEDTGERPYKVDRMLTQCFSSGLFDGIEGVLLGDFKQGTPSGEMHLFEMVFREHFSGNNYPVLMNLPFGHGRKKSTIPLGALVKINTCRNEILLCEDINHA